MIPASPRVAVVVPTLDEEFAIESCVDAIGCHPGTVLAVTDRGSTDGTLVAVARNRPDAVVVWGAHGVRADLTSARG